MLMMMMMLVPDAAAAAAGGGGGADAGDGVVESNAARAVGLGGVPVLLTMFNEWHKSDSRNRHIALRKSVLSVLKNVTNLSQCTFTQLLRLNVH